MAKILTDKWHLYPPPPSRPSLKNADLLNKSLSLKNCNLSLKIGEKSLKYFCLKLYAVKAEKAVLVWCGKSVKFGRVDTRCAVWIRFAPKSKFGSIRFGTRKVWRLNQALGLNPHRSLYFWNRIRFYAKRSSVHTKPAVNTDTETALFGNRFPELFEVPDQFVFTWTAVFLCSFVNLTTCITIKGSSQVQIINFNVKIILVP